MTERTARRPDPARLAAFDVLRAVRADDAYANLALPAALRKHSVSGRDAAFATELVGGTLRGKGTYDAVLAACLDRPLAKVQLKVLDALRLGAHQLLAMRVPAHAAISSSVDLVRSEVGPGVAGFANAVLRKVASADLEGWVAELAPSKEADPIGHAVLAHSHPEWIVSALRDAIGDDELGALLAANNVAPSVTLVARPGRSTQGELPGTPTIYSPFGVISDGGDPGAIPAIAEGRAGVQDEGSQLVALALASAPLDGADERWLDQCAGPGGKAALLAALAAERGARIVANEFQRHRARLVTKALMGAQGVEAVVVADGAHPPWAPASFDRVLVDAPCSGLGALRRRPEARWRRKPSDLDELVPLQKSLLSAAIDSTRVGGVVLYSTCTPVLAETSAVVESVLASRDDVTLEPIDIGVPFSDGPLAGTIQLWPHRHQTDAMFLALLRRTRI